MRGVPEAHKQKTLKTDKYMKRTTLLMVMYINRDYGQFTMDLAAYV